MPLLQRLYKFYRSEARKENQKMPLENFTTECLVGVLESDKNLLRAYTKDFLKIDISDEDTIKISTQKHYKHDSVRRYIDIEIEGNEWICFIENKVDSQEWKADDSGENNQIPTYMKILDDIKKDKKHDNFKCYMRYCTKWSEPKEVDKKCVDKDCIDKKCVDKDCIDKHYFHQFLWHDVANFLGKDCYKENHLVQDFITYLNSQNMSYSMNFQEKDIESLKYIQDNLKRIKQYFEVITHKLLKNAKDWKSDFNKQIDGHNRHILWQPGKYLGSGYWDICIGFSFGEEPSVMISFYIDSQRTNSNGLLEKIDSSIEVLKKTNDKLDTSLVRTESGAYFQLTEPLSEFLNEREMDSKIIEWYKENIGYTVDILESALPEGKWGSFFNTSNQKGQK